MGQINVYTPVTRKGQPLFALSLSLSMHVYSDSLGEEALSAGLILLAAPCKAQEHTSHLNMLDLALCFPKPPSSGDYTITHIAGLS